jgi:hypothetical protein
MSTLAEINDAVDRKVREIAWYAFACLDGGSFISPHQETHLRALVADMAQLYDAQQAASRPPTGYRAPVVTSSSISTTSS